MNTVIIQKSHRPDKKFNAVVNGTKTIPFGSKGMSDFTIHKDEERKQRYINRHRKNEDWGMPTQPLFFFLLFLFKEVVGYFGISLR